MIPSHLWERAKNFFLRNPTEMKLRKNIYVGGGISFVKIHNEIYALGEVIGVGAFGKVKRAINHRGESVAIKLEPGGLASLNPNELLVGRKLGFFKGIAERSLARPKEFWRKHNPYRQSCITERITYKVMPFIEGIELRELLNHKLTYTQRLLIAIKTILALETFHQQRVIHADIKPENIKVLIKGNKINVNLVDINISLILPNNQKYIRSVPSGTLAYAAPEVHTGIYALETDNYSLGVMFNQDLNLPYHLYQQLLCTDVTYRGTLSSALKKLVDELNKQPFLDSYTKQIIVELQQREDFKPFATRFFQTIPQKISQWLAAMSESLFNFFEGNLGWEYWLGKAEQLSFFPSSHKQDWALKAVNRSFKPITHPKLNTPDPQQIESSQKMVKKAPPKTSLMQVAADKHLSSYAKTSSPVAQLLRVKPLQAILSSQFKRKPAHIFLSEATKTVAIEQKVDTCANTVPKADNIEELETLIYKFSQLRITSEEPSTGKDPKTNPFIYYSKSSTPCAQPTVLKPFCLGENLYRSGLPSLMESAMSEQDYMQIDEEPGMFFSLQHPHHNDKHKCKYADQGSCPLSGSQKNRGIKSLDSDYKKNYLCSKNNKLSNLFRHYTRLPLMKKREIRNMRKKDKASMLISSVRWRH